MEDQWLEKLEEGVEEIKEIKRLENLIETKKSQLKNTEDGINKIIIKLKKFGEIYLQKKKYIVTLTGVLLNKNEIQ